MQPRFSSASFFGARGLSLDKNDEYNITATPEFNIPTVPQNMGQG